MRLPSVKPEYIDRVIQGQIDELTKISFLEFNLRVSFRFKENNSAK